jgi:uncharacterized protein (DUF433 family)
MTENLLDRIEINPGIMLGKPVVKGTRITVELILEKLSTGATIEQLLDAHPRLTMRRNITCRWDSYSGNENGGKYG